MALESVFAIAPPLVGEVNKDTQIEGEKESKDDDDGDLTEPAEDLDLEEGEILDDSEGEVPADNGDKDGDTAEVPSAAENKEKKDDLHTNDDIVEGTDCKKKKKKKKRKSDVSDEPIITLVKKKKIKYVDHDRIEDDEQDWFESYSSRYSRRDSRIDYSRELAEYRGSPFSSPERSPHDPYDSPDFSPDHRRSPSPYSTPSYGEDDYDESEVRTRRPRQSLARSRLGRKPPARGGKQKRLSENKKSRIRGNISRGRKRDVKMRQLCKFFLENKCIKGSDCPFSHAGNAPKRKELCKFYLTGYCGKGESCLFMHEDFPCKFYHTGAKCYSEKNCRFSHAPLNDESRRMLDRHLESNKCDDDYNSKSGADPDDKSSSKHKRPSLLGSPPRHVKEAVETKRWQQEIQQMQQNKKGHFDRQFSPHKGILNSPPRFSKPNFYVDTLKSPTKSPIKKSPPAQTVTFKLSQSSRFLKLSRESAKQQSLQDGEGNSQEEWQKKKTKKNIAKESNSKLLEAEGEAAILEKPDSTKEHSVDKGENHPLELGAGDMGELSSIMGATGIQESLTEKPTVSEQTPVSSQSQESGGGDSQSLSEGDLPLISQNPITIPSHLPRKQKELFLRIQQHQKEAVSGESGTDGGDMSEDHDTKNEAEEKEEKWYSSEDDDDDDDTEDQPLTAVLKKLQEMPPSKSQPAATATSPKIDIAKMLSTIRQQVSQNTASNGSTFSNQQNDFWQNILSGTVPPPVANRGTVPFAAELSGTNNDIKDFIPRSNSDPRIQMFSSSEQSLLQPISPVTTATSRDPRMQNNDRVANVTRDPRLQSRSLDFRDNRVSNVPREFQLPGLISASDISISLPEGTQLQDKFRDMQSILQNKTAVIVDGGKGMGNIPYKLRAVTVSQPNYTSYLIASQSDPKLLNDPRLRKHLKNIELLHPHVTRQFPKELAIPIPSLHNSLSGEGQQQQSIPRHQDSQMPSSVLEPWQLPDIKLPPPRMADPRMAKIAMTDPRLARQQGNITPPHSGNIESNWQQSSTTVTSISNTTPITTHLPRAITDPRLARLHHPVDPRRVRHVSDHSHQEQNSHYQGLVQVRRPPSVSNNDAVHDILSPRDDFMRKPDDFMRKPDDFMRKPDDFMRKPDDFMRKPDDFMRKPDDFMRKPDEFIRKPDEFIRKPDEFIRKPERTSVDATHPVNHSNNTNENKETCTPQPEKTDSDNNDSEKQQKITSHNRKSSMDYASPLNTYDSNSTNSSGYNSYNRRPKPRVPTSSPTIQASIPDTSSSTTPVTETPVVSSQESDRVQSASFTSSETPVSVADSVDISSSLKDMFKTIDPTASPFC